MIYGQSFRQSIALAILSVGLFSSGVVAAASTNTEIVAGFSPAQIGVSAEEIILTAIQEAKTSIRVAAYSFTSKSIATELVAAKNRGVDVKIVADDGAAKGRYSATTYCANQGIPVRVNSRYAIMHNKFLIIDEISVQTGSFNYTTAASKSNAENVIYIRGHREVASQYAVEWTRLWAESVPLAPKY